MSFKLSQIQPRAAELAQRSCTLAFSSPGELKVWIELASVRHLSTFSDMNIIFTWEKVKTMDFLKTIAA